MAWTLDRGSHLFSCHDPAACDVLKVRVEFDVRLVDMPPHHHHHNDLVFGPLLGAWKDLQCLAVRVQGRYHGYTLLPEDAPNLTSLSLHLGYVTELSHI